MAVWLLLASLLVLIAGGLGALAARTGGGATRSALLGVVGGTLAALWSAGSVLAGAGGRTAVQVPWSLPAGSFHVGLDALSAFFIVPVALISLLSAIYGAKYLDPGRALGGPWCAFNCLVASMLLVVSARDAVLFLLAWEGMALASFFLVAFEHEKAQVREAAWLYLIATHLGTAFLIAAVLLLGHHAGSFDFAVLANAFSPPGAGLLLGLLIVGFGTKAGFVPLHVWLPEAHPAAPSHVSAVMSGVMIKTGIYGLVRFLPFLGPPEAWWGWTLVGIGLVSGVVGVVFALAQHDLKRLLAYHSVENVGIITLGLGVGVLGVALDSPPLAALGFAGGLFHVLNHALFKALLFLGAGAVLHATGTVEMDRLGGLAKTMRFTAPAFLVGALAICGLPPFNGFASEFLVYLAAFRDGLPNHLQDDVLVLAVIAGLALIGGLAAACFTKAFGTVFLGLPRTPDAEKAHEAHPAMLFAMGVLAASCLVVGVASPALVGLLAEPVSAASGLPGPEIAAQLAWAREPLGLVVAAFTVLLAVSLGLVQVQRRLLARARVGTGPTWDCGFAAPTARMQYTSSSFARPLTNLFSALLATRSQSRPLAGHFPASGHLETHTPDVFRERIFDPLFSGVAAGLARARWIQHGKLQVYVLYIALTLLAVLYWELR